MTDTTLSLAAPGASSSNWKETKRKYSATDIGEGSLHGLSLELALGSLPSSSDESKASSATCWLDEDVPGIGIHNVSYLSAHHLQAKKLRFPGNAAATNDDLALSLSSGTSSSLVAGHQPGSVINAPFICQPVSVNASSSISMQGHFDEASASIGMHGHFEEASASSRRTPELAVLSFGAAEQVYDLGNSSKLDSAAAANSFEVSSASGSTMQRSGNSKERRSCSSKMCRFQGCTKGARGASGLCIAHGGGRRCQREGCNKGAEGRTVFCKAHGGGRRCQHLGCTKSAEGRTDFCIAHGGGRRCSHEGCTRAARGKSGLCIKHGGGKRCQVQDCKRSAEGLSGLCISHGGGRRCKFPECLKGAQGSTHFCKAHGGGKRCTIPGCTKGAEGSTPFCKAHGGGKRCAFDGGGICPKSVHGGTLYCVAHGGGKRCAHPRCPRSARGRTNYCVRHGGGKRCKVEDCGKSAQGRTDFCKAHGGGTRCSWGQPASAFGSGGPPCDKFARGRTGLCASHKAMIEEPHVHGAGLLGWIGIRPSEPLQLDARGKGKLLVTDDIFTERGHDEQQHTLSWNNGFTCQFGTMALPEGRVHGGRLVAMSMFDQATTSRNQIGSMGNDAAPAPSEFLGTGYIMPPS